MQFNSNASIKKISVLYLISLVQNVKHMEKKRKLICKTRLVNLRLLRQRSTNINWEKIFKLKTKLLISMMFVSQII